jgi:glycosyltransferase involved in cell wall biosynthesis
VGSPDAKSIRVLYSFPHQLGRTGTGTTAWHQVAGLIEAGQRVTVMCGTCELQLPGHVEVLETMRLGRWKIPYRAIGVERAWAWHDRQVAKFLEREKSRIDVVHAWPSGALTTLRTARRLNIKSFLERPNTHTAYAYDVVAREYEKLGLHPEKKRAHTFNVKRLRREEDEFQMADRLLCPSEFVARTFMERGYSASRISRHRYGCDPGLFTPDAQPDEQDAFRMVFVGTCDPRKGLHLALRAWLDSPACENGEFAICGTFAPGYRELVAKMLAHRSVKELGFRRDVAKIMGQAHALVLPTLEEGSALVTYEARAAGCVLLVSEAAGALVDHMSNGLMHRVGDVGTLSQHITLLARNRELLARLRQQSLAQAATLSWSTAARELVDCYAECLRATDQCEMGAR